MTDIELWTRILKGDKVAFEELYHRYYSPLFGYALRLNFDEETIKLANQLEIDTNNYVILSEEELEERIKQMEKKQNAKKQK